MKCGQRGRMRHRLRADLPVRGGHERRVSGEAVWPGQQDAGSPARGQVRAVAVQAAPVDVADQEVGAALVAAFADLAQQVLDRDPGFFRVALAEVVAVGSTRVGRYFGTRCSRSDSLARS